jgi:hypothetical protein
MTRVGHIFSAELDERCMLQLGVLKTSNLMYVKHMH